MKLGGMEFKDPEMTEKFKRIYKPLLEIVTEAEVSSPEWNLGWDLLRSYIDNVRYAAMERNSPKACMAQPIEIAPN